MIFAFSARMIVPLRVSCRPLPMAGMCVICTTGSWGGVSLREGIRVSLMWMMVVMVVMMETARNRSGSTLVKYVVVFEL
jgi:hypothetical protein